MNWFIENWTLLVVIAAIVSIGLFRVRQFSQLSTEQQLDNVRKWLLYAVIVAEKSYGGGTGTLKLRSVFNDFVSKFPWLAQTISFKQFSEMVDDALDEMKKILANNKNLQSFVDGEQL